MRIWPCTRTLSELASALTAQPARSSRSSCMPHLTSTASVEAAPCSAPRKWPMNQPRNGAPSVAALPMTMPAESGATSDDALVATVDRDLGAGRAREQRPAHLDHQLADIATRDLDPEHVVRLVLLDAQAVA